MSRQSSRCCVNSRGLANAIRQTAYSQAAAGFPNLSAKVDLTTAIVTTIQALAWPAAIFGGVWLLRREIRALFERISQIKLQGPRDRRPRDPGQDARGAVVGRAPATIGRRERQGRCRRVDEVGIGLAEERHHRELEAPPGPARRGRQTERATISCPCRPLCPTP